MRPGRRGACLAPVQWQNNAKQELKSTALGPLGHTTIPQCQYCATGREAVKHSLVAAADAGLPQRLTSGSHASAQPLFLQLSSGVHWIFL